MRAPSPSGSTRADAADAVDVALDDMAAERLAGPQRRLDVDAVARPEAAERRARERLRDGVEGELPSSTATTVRQTPSIATESPTRRRRRSRRVDRGARRRRRLDRDDAPSSRTMPVNTARLRQP